MSKNIYIATTESRSGKSAVALGLMEALLRNIDKVGFFRPIINVDKKNPCDKDINLINKHYNLDIPYEACYAYTTQAANELITLGKHDELMEGILNKYNTLANECDFVVCEGTDFFGAHSAFEFDINANIANNLGCPVLVISNGSEKTVEDIITTTRIAIESFEEKGCTVLATIVNRVEVEPLDDLLIRLKARLGREKQLIYAIPDTPILSKPSMREIAQALDAEVLFGASHLDRLIQNSIVVSMQLSNFLDFINEGSLIITTGDRSDILLGSLVSLTSLSLPHISGILLAGGIKPEKNVQPLLQGLADLAPILHVDKKIFDAVLSINSVNAALLPENHIKIAAALGNFETHVNTTELREKITNTKSTVVTPKMFEYGLIKKARKHRIHIVLPEGSEDRILKAAEILLHRDVVDITLLTKGRATQGRISKLALDLEGVNIIDPVESPYFEDYAKTYHELRKHKGITEEVAKDTMADISYFGTMMVYKGAADGMVSGAIHSTQQTIRPAFEFIRTKPGCSIVSSAFLMCLADRVLVYGDCAVNPNPNAQELAEIAISSSETARTFGIDPRVAMLSYSTGASGKGADVEKVREATKIAKEKCPDLKIEGPIQYDAAIDPDVAKTKMPNSEVAGKATVFIFPDLNTGNNTYKAVQRSANAVAIGPVLQGLKKPVNDLSRGCTIPDIVNTVAITAIQAQAEKGLL